MPLPVFPTFPGLTWDIERAAEWKTLRSRSDTGQFRTVQRQSYPNRQWRLTVASLRDNDTVAANVAPTGRDAELRTLRAFIDSRGGGALPFWFTDPIDDAVTAQQIGTGNGSSTQFPVVRTLQAGTVAFVEPVGALNVVTSVLVAGVERVGTTTLNSPYDGWITISPTPANGAAIVVTGTYYWRVRFDDDNVGIRAIVRNLFECRRIDLEQAKL